MRLSYCLVLLGLFVVFHSILSHLTLADAWFILNIEYFQQLLSQFSINYVQTMPRTYSMPIHYEKQMYISAFNRGANTVIVTMLCLIVSLLILMPMFLFFFLNKNCFSKNKWMLRSLILHALSNDDKLLYLFIFDDTSNSWSLVQEIANYVSFLNVLFFNYQHHQYHHLCLSYVSPLPPVFKIKQLL